MRASSGCLTWSRKRLATAVVVAAASAAFLLATTGMAADRAAGWTGYVAVAAAAILSGLLAGSYMGAPIGAAATFCDLRWPVAGLFGVIWANSPGKPRHRSRSPSAPWPWQ